MAGNVHQCYTWEGSCREWEKASGGLMCVETAQTEGAVMI